jgi:hypothetical protein
MTVANRTGRRVLNLGVLPLCALALWARPAAAELAGAGATPGQLKLDGKVLADIYLGNIAKWNDPAVARLNPDLKLPSQAIAVIHRSDGLAKEALQFFDWAYRSGTAMAEALDYGPMPDPVVGLVQESWKATRTPNGAPIWTGPPS